MWVHILQIFSLDHFTNMSSSMINAFCKNIFGYKNVNFSLDALVFDSHTVWCLLPPSYIVVYTTNSVKNSQIA